MSTQSGFDSNYITFVGDIHGEFSSIHKIIAIEKPVFVVQAGDFGIWPKTKYCTNYDSTDVYFCKGNHEWHDYLDIFNRDGAVVKLPSLSETPSDLYYCRNGAILQRGGLNILFIGGARSMDKSSRTPYKSWWPQEEMSEVEFTIMLENIKKFDEEFGIDVVVSHEAPDRVRKHPASTILNNRIYLSFENTTSAQLEQVASVLKNCFLWVHGHYHNFNDVIIDDTRFVCLDIPFDITSSDGWISFTKDQLNDLKKKRRKLQNETTSE